MSKLYASHRMILARTGIQLFLPLSLLPLPTYISLTPLVLVSLVLALVSEEESHGTKPAPRKEEIYLVSAFLFSFVLSVVASTDFLHSIDSALVLLPAVLLALLYREHNSEKEAITSVSRGMIYMVLAGCGLVTLLRPFEPELQLAEFFSGIGSPGLVVPNDMLYAVIAMPFLVHVVLSDTCKVHKLLATIGIGLALLAVSMTDSRSCALAIAVGLGAFLYFKYPRFLLFTVLLGLAALVFCDHIYHFEASYTISETIRSNERLGLWYLAGSWVMNHPTLGFGPGQFGFVYENYMHLTELPENFQLDNRHVTWAHSLFAEALIERGFTGFIILTTMLLHMSYRMRLRVDNSSSKFDWSLPVFISFIVFLFAGALELTLQRSWVVVFLALFTVYYLSCNSKPVSCRSSSSKSQKTVLEFLALLFILLAVVALNAQRDKENWTDRQCSLLMEIVANNEVSTNFTFDDCTQLISSKLEHSTDISDPRQYWLMSERQQKWTVLNTIWWRWSDWKLYLSIGLSLVLLRLFESVIANYASDRAEDWEIGDHK